MSPRRATSIDDFRPYLYKTNDYGQTWTKITDGIPEDDFTRVIREDPARRGLLYAGTETGVYVSFDDGGALAVAATATCPSCRSTTSSSRTPT